MKYEAKVDLRNANTSHALLVELVGRDKRVLDVGCASGYLGEVLKCRGCTVAGVEADPQAADAAKALLDEVVVGDVGELDLLGHFGEGSFDVLVFGDVLEHVVDPVSVLRKVRPLLRDSGFVVASIPNVAHGAVRLSLMAGRFDYRPLGLLDDTHVRFFTRSSLYDALREGGFAPVEVRRTTAGIFETEIAVRREDYLDDVVSAVEGDPDAMTYQFVVKAVPEENASGHLASSPPPPMPAPRCRIGIWARCGPDNLRDALALRVTRSELAARLPDASIRLFTEMGYLDRDPHTGGEPVEPLGVLPEERLAELANALDCMVVTGDIPNEWVTDEGEHASLLVETLPGADEGECPVFWSAVRLPADPSGDVGGALTQRSLTTVVHERPSTTALVNDESSAAVPDPLLLTSRILKADVLQRRLEFLRVMGHFPRDGQAIVVEVHPGMFPHAAALGTALDAALAATPGSSVVLIQLDPGGVGVSGTADALAGVLRAPAYQVPPSTQVDDVVAAIAAAAVVVTTSLSAVSLAIAYARPHAVLDLAGGSPLSDLARETGNLDGVVARPGELGELLDHQRFRALPAVAAELESLLDLHFDRLATSADGAAAARPRRPEMGPVLPAPEYVAALESAHARMQQRLDGERLALADHLFSLRDRHETELRQADARLEATMTTLTEAVSVENERSDGLQVQVDALQAEVDAFLPRVERLNYLERLITDREQEVEHLRAERNALARDLEAVTNLRTLRLLRPVRAFYAKLRGSHL